MKYATLGALLVAANSAIAGVLLFDVQSSKEGLYVPITLCLNGIEQLSCQRYTVNGKTIEIKARTKNHGDFQNAGIKVDTTGYKLTGCTPYNNGYCLFYLNNRQYSRIILQ